jgi:hypothetical protein
LVLVDFPVVMVGSTSSARTDESTFVVCVGINADNAQSFPSSLFP